MRYKGREYYYKLEGEDLTSYYKFSSIFKALFIGLLMYIFCEVIGNVACFFIDRTDISGKYSFLFFILALLFSSIFFAVFGYLLYSIGTFIVTYISMIIKNYKLPLIKLTYKQSKQFLKALPNFKVQRMNFSREEYYCSYIKLNGIEKFYGFYCDEDTALKGNWMCSFIICCAIIVNKVSCFLKEIGLNYTDKKNERAKEKTSQMQIHTETIQNLQKYVNKLKTQSTEEIENATDILKDVYLK